MRTCGLKSGPRVWHRRPACAGTGGKPVPYGVRSRYFVVSLTVAGVALRVASAAGQGTHHGSHPPLPDPQFVFECRWTGGDGPAVVEAPIVLASTMDATDLDQVIELPKPITPIRLLKYLPRAQLDQMVVPDAGPAAGPAVQLAIRGPTQSHELWLLANDAERNRLTSFIGTWRYMAVDQPAQRDDLFEQFREELTRQPRLFVRAGGGGPAVEVEAKPGTGRDLEALGCKLRVLEFYPHFAIDDKTKQPTNRSDERMNPAALVEIEHDGRSEQEWVFARFPEFQKDKTEARPFQITLDCPVGKPSTMPDFLLLTVGGGKHEVWTRHGGKTTAGELVPAKPVEIAGSQYTFTVTHVVPKGRLVEEYRPAEGKSGVSALQIATADAAGTEVKLWLALGKERTLPTAAGPVTVVFGPRREGARGGHQ